MFNLNDLVNIFKTSQRSTIYDNLIIFSAYSYLDEHLAPSETPRQM